MPPFFTIITSTYNAAATLPHLLDSLASQTCRDFNWIVQDGASSDATMQIVEQYRDHLPEILADSGRDSGIYDAWNKAIDRWQDNMGEWVLFLGADDTLHSSTTLQEVLEHIISVKNDNIIFAAGNINLVDTNGIIIRTVIVDKNSAFKNRYRGTPLPHSGLFTKKNFLVSTKFDTKFKIAGDYDFILKTWKLEHQTIELNMLVTDMGNEGISHTSKTISIRKKELFLAIKNTNTLQSFLFIIFIIKHNIKLNIKRFLLKTKLGQNLYTFYKKYK